MKWLVAVATLLVLGGLTTEWLHGSLHIFHATMWIVTILCGAPIGKQAFREIKRRKLGIKTLITIAVIGAVIIGEYFEAAIVVYLFELGSFLENHAMNKTRSVVQNLFELFPDQATVLRDGQEIRLYAGDIVQGDYVLAHPGEKIPVDGCVVNGSAFVKEAAITGEPIPSPKQLGDFIYSGSIVESGYLLFRAEKVGEETTISRMLQLIEYAEEAKSGMQRMLDRFAKYYTPGVALLAVLVFAWTHSLVLALTLLVVACPGALVIATPVSVVAGIGSGAKRGMLIKGGESLERMAGITAVAFDKTGTLTQGEPEVEDIVSYRLPPDSFLRMIASAEMPSEHFVGKAVTKAAREQIGEEPVMPTTFQEFPGKGIRAKVDGQTVYAGNRRFLQEQGIEVGESAENHRTTIYVATPGEVLGHVSIADRIRSDAKQAVQNLHRLGIRKIVLLTGDSEMAAREVATAVGIEEIHASLLPDEKVRCIKELQAEGYAVAMVGDGINDGPALAAAAAGITLHSGTGLALDTADAILMSNKISMVSDAIRLCKKTTANIKQNVFFAIFVAFVLILGAIQGSIVLASGMFIHEFSILLVIGNALRLLADRNGNAGLANKQMLGTPARHAKTQHNM